jgi:hypothetical protein
MPKDREGGFRGRKKAAAYSVKKVKKAAKKTAKKTAKKVAKKAKKRK